MSKKNKEPVNDDGLSYHQAIVEAEKAQVLPPQVVVPGTTGYPQTVDTYYPPTVDDEPTAETTGEVTVVVAKEE